MIAEIKLSEKVADNLQNTEQKGKGLGKQRKDNYRTRLGLQYQHNNSRKENKENYVEGKNELIWTGDSNFRVISKGQGTAQSQNACLVHKRPQIPHVYHKNKKKLCPKY